MPRPLKPLSGPLRPGESRRYLMHNVRRRKKKSLPQMIKQISLRQCETKKSHFLRENTNLFHNGTLYVSNLLHTTQGVEAPEGGLQQSDNRVGDQVIARSLSVRLWISNKSDRPNVMYRAFLFRYNTEVSLATVGDSYFWAGTDGVGAIMNRMLDHPARDRVKILSSRIVQPSHEANYSQGVGSAGTVYEKSRLVTMYLPLKNKKIYYNEDGSAEPKYKTIGLAIVPYDAYGTPTSDIIGSFGYQATFSYKDP